MNNITIDLGDSLHLVVGKAVDKDKNTVKISEATKLKNNAVFS